MKKHPYCTALVFSALLSIVSTPPSHASWFYVIPQYAWEDEMKKIATSISTAKSQNKDISTLEAYKADMEIFQSLAVGWSTVQQAKVKLSNNQDATGLSPQQMAEKRANEQEYKTLKQQYETLIKPAYDVLAVKKNYLPASAAEYLFEKAKGDIRNVSFKTVSDRNQMLINFLEFIRYNTLPLESKASTQLTQEALNAYQRRYQDKGITSSYLNDLEKQGIPTQAFLKDRNRYDKPISELSDSEKQAVTQTYIMRKLQGLCEILRVDTNLFACLQDDATWESVTRNTAGAYTKEELKVFFAQWKKTTSQYNLLAAQNGWLSLDQFALGQEVLKGYTARYGDTLSFGSYSSDVTIFLNRLKDANSVQVFRYKGAPEEDSGKRTLTIKEAEADLEKTVQSATAILPQDMLRRSIASVNYDTYSINVIPAEKEDASLQEQLALAIATQEQSAAREDASSISLQDQMLLMTKPGNLKGKEREAFLREQKRAQELQEKGNKIDKEKKEKQKINALEQQDALLKTAFDTMQGILLRPLQASYKALQNTQKDYTEIGTIPPSASQNKLKAWALSYYTLQAQRAAYEVAWLTQWKVFVNSFDYKDGTKNSFESEYRIGTSILEKKQQLVESVYNEAQQALINVQYCLSLVKDIQE